MTENEEKKLVFYIEKLTKENELMRILTTRKGFYNMYFNSLKNNPSNELAFDEVNNLYFQLFKHKRYTDFKTFQKLCNN